MNKTVAMVLAGGRAKGLSVLTERRAAAAVIYGGAYRAIDFALTNVAELGIGRVGVLAQYRPSSVMDHVGTGMAWDLAGANRAVRFLPPYLGPGASAWQRGPAEALLQNIDFIKLNASEEVIALSGDDVCRVDLQPLLSFHRECAADMTLAFTPVQSDPSRFAVGELNARGEVIHFTDRPEKPRTNLASAGIYVFRRDVLIDELLRAEASGEPAALANFGRLLPQLVSRRRAFGWVFRDNWYHINTLDSYYAFHRGLVAEVPQPELHRWQVRSNAMARRSFPAPPTRFLPGARVESSLVCPGCVVGGTVLNSVISPGVRIDPGAVVSNSILWDNVSVHAGARLDRVISDKRCIVHKDARVGVGEVVPSEEMPDSLTCGATVLGMDVQVPPSAEIGRGCIIHPGVSGAALALPVPSGQSVPRTHPEE